MSHHQEREAEVEFPGLARQARLLGTASCWMAVPAFLLFAFALTGFAKHITALFTTSHYQTLATLTWFAVLFAGLGLAFGLGSLNGYRPWRVRAVLGIALNAPVFVIGGAIAIAIDSPVCEFWYHFGP